MVDFLLSLTGAFIGSAISVYVASMYFYKLGKKHGAKIREREVIEELIQEMEERENVSNQTI